MKTKRLHKSPLIQREIQEINDSVGSPEGIFPIKSKTTDKYQHKSPRLLYEYKTVCT